MVSLRRYHGKYVNINFNHPDAIGICDRSGFPFNHKDLVRQMDWVGNNFVWTGLMVGKPFLDEPQVQNRPPREFTDPTPVKDPRPPTPYLDPEYPRVPPYNQLFARLREVGKVQ